MIFFSKILFLKENSMKLFEITLRTNLTHYSYFSSPICVLSLLLLDSPIISSSKNNLTVTEGENAEILCTAEGNPEPNVTWTRGSMVVNRVSGTNATLIIRVTNRTDAGMYTCHAEAASAVMGRDTLSSSQNINLIIKC